MESGACCTQMALTTKETGGSTLSKGLGLTITPTATYTRALGSKVNDMASGRTSSQSTKSNLWEHGSKGGYKVPDKLSTPVTASMAPG